MTSPTEWALWGPQFALQQPPPAGAGMPSGWLRLSALVDDPAVLGERLAQTARALAVMSPGANPGAAGQTAPVEAEVEPRVVASLTHMGLVGRVLAAGIGLAVLGSDPAELLAGDAWWQSVPGPAYPLAAPMAPASTEPAASSDVAGLTLDDTWVDRLTSDLVEQHHVPARTLWGNIASVIHATRGIITRATPEHARRVDVVAARLLDTPRIHPGERVPTTAFRRRSCCLLYRLTPDHTPVCGDCVLDPSRRA